MSAEKAEKFYPRAPRYILQYKDNTILRFAAYPKGSKKLQTRVINLSESGMAFLLPMLDNPQMDEIIKVEFIVPNFEAVACFAKVIRIENHHIYDKMRNRQEFKLVAVSFVDLPVAQRQMIREGLAHEFERLRKEYTREQYRLKMQYLAIKSGQNLKAIVDWPVKKLLKVFQAFDKKKEDHNKKIYR